MNKTIQTIILVFSLARFSAAQDVSEIVKRFVEASTKNAEAAHQYTFEERRSHFSYDKKGNKKFEGSETMEILFVEGEEYVKQIAKNDKPLSEKDQAKEEKRLQETAEQRRNQRKSGVSHKQTNVGLSSDLLTLFDNKLVGEESVAGRKTWVVECTPKTDHVAADQHEKEAMSFRRKLWIDQSAYMPLKAVSLVLQETGGFLAGFTFEFEFEHVNNDAWLIRSLTLDGRMEVVKFIKPTIRTEQVYSKFRKFNVASTITVSQQN